VDLRHLPSVQEFISHILKHYKRIDILINNAAQTIRRPRAYYRLLVDQERALCNECNSNQSSRLVKGFGQDPYLIEYKPTRSENRIVPFGLPLDLSLPKSAALTQMKLLPSDIADRDDEAFPPGSVDEHNEQLDTRRDTSWTHTIDQVSPVELMEVQIVNSTVPFMLISSLTPLLQNAANVSQHKRSFVINVTSAEGVFNMNKRGIHPHTNMAKAALNMMTKSIADPFAAMNIFATAVDTGWVTKMKPESTGRFKERGATPAPLRDKDGASRVLHPAFIGYTSDTRPAFGVMYRNYEIVPWN